MKSKQEVAKVVFARHQIKGSDRKIAKVMTLIRGKNVLDAVNQLLFLKTQKAPEILKILNSCIANAVHNCGYKKENLILKIAAAEKSRVLRRFHIRGRGRITRIEKSYSHVTFGVVEVNA